jgi:hypothetical protein
MTADITDNKLLEAVQAKVAYIGTDYAPAIKAMIARHMPPEGTTTPHDVRRIPQDMRAAFLETLRDF